MWPKRLRIWTALGGLVFFAVPLPAADVDSDGVKLFEARIKPILVDHCYRCHSEKAETVEADLYVDTREGLLRGGDQGPAIEPGEPDRSLLIKAVQYEMDDLKMPPDKRLDDRQIMDLKRWIKIGAPYPRQPKKFDPNRLRRIGSVH